MEIGLPQIRNSPANWERVDNGYRWVGATPPGLTLCIQNAGRGTRYKGQRYRVAWKGPNGWRYVVYKSGARRGTARTWSLRPAKARAHDVLYSAVALAAAGCEWPEGSTVYGDSGSLYQMPRLDGE